MLLCGVDLVLSTFLEVAGVFDRAVLDALSLVFWVVVDTALILVIAEDRTVVAFALDGVTELVVSKIAKRLII